MNIDAAALRAATSSDFDDVVGPFTRELIVARVDTEGLATVDLHALEGRGRVQEVIDSKGAGGYEISNWCVRVAARDGNNCVDVHFYRDKSHQQIRGAQDITLRDAVEAVEDICAAANECGAVARVVGAAYCTLNATMQVCEAPRPVYAALVPGDWALRIDLDLMAAELRAFKEITGGEFAGAQVEFINVALCSGDTTLRAEIVFNGATCQKNPKLCVTGTPKVRVKGARSLRQLALIRAAVSQILRSRARVLRPAEMEAEKLTAAWMGAAVRLTKLPAKHKTAALALLAETGRALAQLNEVEPVVPADALRQFVLRCAERVCELNHAAVDEGGNEGERRD
jgi:hypothetical protein